MKERVILVALVKNSKEKYKKISDLEELKALTETAGGETLGSFIQVKEHPSPKTLLGKGKIEELKRICQQHKVDLLIFDNQLTPSQIRNIEEIIKVRTIDRRALILDIFARHAHTAEAMLQVELAQLYYQLTMLTGKGTTLSQLGGGIGTRGPGEKQLEVDKRKIRERIHFLKKSLEKLKKTKEIQRQQREYFFKIALAGYTNSGKSTLFKTLTKEDVYISDELFATLDANTKAFEIFPNIKVLITDTIGFIKNLPPQLISAFHATLEDIKRSDLIIHLVDATAENLHEKINIVKETLKEIGCDEEKIVLVFNKIDLIFEKAQLLRLKREYPNAIFISALKGTNLNSLKNLIKKRIRKFLKRKTLKIPKEKGYLLKEIYQKTYVINFKENEKEYQIKVLSYPNILYSILSKI
ncbi:MAG: GTPase HflX [candidate division WOR-3 bacterium]|nr:GTPase HflX [candidate division WOR-3 bacterium]MCX7836737.1 GTPase HflX [candidate division WOR-3 bacterium]MDW8113372.1 GTPase HflX [candidate division WOR-3 bacterium]